MSNAEELAVKLKRNLVIVNVSQVPARSCDCLQRMYLLNKSGNRDQLVFVTLVVGCKRQPSPKKYRFPVLVE